MMKVLERSHDNVFGLECGGKITAEDIESVIPVLDEAVNKHGKISWLMVIEKMEYPTLKAMYEDSKWLLQNLKKFDRMAVVGSKKWEELLIRLDGMVFGEKYFDVSDIEKAWSYIEGK